MTRLPLPSARNKTRATPRLWPQNLLRLPLGLSLSLPPSSRRRRPSTQPLHRASSHGGHGRSAGEAARRASAPPRAVGASAARGGRPPHARHPCRVPARESARSPQAVLPPAGRRGAGRRRGDVRRRDRGAPGQAHGPPARRGRPAARAPADPLASSAASASASSSSTPGAAVARGGRGCPGEAVEPAGAHAAASRRQVVGRVGALVAEAAAQVRPVLRVADGGGDRGGRLRFDRRTAAAAAQKAAARRTAAARYAVPRALANRGHRRRVPSAGRVAPPPAGAASSVPELQLSNHLT